MSAIMKIFSFELAAGRKVEMLPEVKETLHFVKRKLKNQSFLHVAFVIVALLVH